MNLEVLSKIAPIASVLIALIAAIFISRQIINIRRNREVDTLLKIITLSDSDSMQEAKDWLRYDLQKYSSAEQLRGNKEALKNFSHIVHLFETMGVLVNNGYIPQKLIFDKYGLLIVGAWNRLQSLISAMRIHSQSYEYAENFELMVSRYDKWARKYPLKVAQGQRMKLRDGISYLDYGGKEDEPSHQSDEADLKERGSATSRKDPSQA